MATKKFFSLIILLFFSNFELLEHIRYSALVDSRVTEELVESQQHRRESGEINKRRELQLDSYSSQVPACFYNINKHTWE